MSNTLLLDTVAWDLLLDAQGNIAMATNPYALAQDAASQIKLFLGEWWYDTTQGVPYFSQILGQPPSTAVLKAQLARAALTVPGVTAAQVFLTAFSNRVISGQVQVTGAAGVVTAASFALTPTGPVRPAGHLLLQSGAALELQFGGRLLL